MADKSTIDIIGRLAFDPDHRMTSGGTDVCRLTIPTHRSYESKGEWKEVTTWHRISVFGNQAKNCADYLKKGSLVHVEGSLEPDEDTGNPRIWQGDDGKSRTSYDIIGYRVTFLADIKSRDEVNDDYVPGFDDQDW
jgi:single-strand DNA-binding protein